MLSRTCTNIEAKSILRYACFFIMNQKYYTYSNEETQKLGEKIASQLKGGEVLCLSGDLGAGKTTFTQGLLKGLGAQGPYTSPTFVIMKKYEINNQAVKNISTAYHLDIYRVEALDVLDLGWNEITNCNDNVVIVEWAEKIKEIIPERAIWIQFRWINEHEREIKIIK